ncbi:MAG: hypothetical protein IJR13_07705 [Bacteroidales bacterium]|nr:hypothetical protein [Bacteroidales bacterium]
MKNNEILTPSQMARNTRDRKIISLYRRKKKDAVNITALYYHIAVAAHCSVGTVLNVLKRKGLL